MALELSDEAREIYLLEIAAFCGVPRSALDASDSGLDAMARRWHVLKPAIDEGVLTRGDVDAMLGSEDGSGFVNAQWTQERGGELPRMWGGAALAVLRSAAREYARDPKLLQRDFKRTFRQEIDLSEGG